MNIHMTIIPYLLDILFPKKCVGCGKMGKYVCSECEVGLWEEEQICPVCARNSRYGLPHKYCHEPYSLDGLMCLWAYDGMARKLISRAKYKGRFDLLKFFILNFKFEINIPMFKFNEFLKEKPVVVPVPLHPKRLRERGFNQAEIFAKAFAVRHSLAFNSHLLQRVKDTGHQVGRTREERLKAVEGAFCITPLKNTSVLLVDDVWTTGATMNECCKTLKKAGVKKVWGLVLAR